MPTRAPRRCTTPGCPGTPTPGTAKCLPCQTRARQDSDQRRGTSTQRGYGQAHRDLFRAEVLRRQPICVLCHASPSTVADHWPTPRRALAAQGLDPDDPRHGRGLCKRCHDQHTARDQPGGWHQDPGGSQF